MANSAIKLQRQDDLLSMGAGISEKGVKPIVQAKVDRLLANKFYHSSSPPKYKMTTIEEQKNILSVVDTMVPRSKVKAKPDSKGGKLSSRYDSKEQSIEKPLSQGSETRPRMDD